MTGAVAVAVSNPYPGLRPFDTEESELFFGRETQTDELLRCLGRSRFVAVIGSSGSGKSSLVRAGLLPALVGGFLPSAGSHWHIAVLRPGSDPISALAGGLHSALKERALTQTNSSGSISRDILEITLMRSSLGLIEVARQAGIATHENLLLVVDQFEELFRFQRAQATGAFLDNAARFVGLLLEAVRQNDFPIHVLITMRADFLGDCSQFRDLPETINKGLYLIPRMTRDQLRQAITGPAAVSGSFVTPRLAQELLNDLGDDPDQLPVLQHALMRAWNYWRNTPGGDALDSDAYHATGGMAEALSRHANEVWEELSDAGPHSERLIAKGLFQCLTEKGPDNREVRRPTRFGDICQILDADPIIVKKVIERFREEDRAFLMPPRIMPINENSVVDISHESLIRKWDRLRTWVDEEAQSRATYIRLAQAGRLNRRAEAGLWRNPDLQIALDWKERARPNQAWAQRYDPDFQTAMEFLDQSVAALLAEQLREAEARRRELAAVRSEKQRKRAIVIMTIAVLIAGLFFWLLIKNQKLLRETIAGRLAWQAALLQKHKDAALADSVLLAVDAMRDNPSVVSDDVIRKGLALLPKHVWRLKQPDGVNEVAFSRDGKYVASADNATARVREVATGKEIAHLVHGGRVFSIAFSPDGRHLATGSEDGTARIMDVAAGGAEVCRSQHGERGKDDGSHDVKSVRVVAYSPDGRLVATGSLDATARTMDAANCREIARLPHGKRVVALAFSPDGRYLLTGSEDHTARLMNAITGKEVWSLEHGGGVNAVAFSPNGRYIATAGADGDACVGDAATGRRISSIQHEGAVFSVAFSPDNRYLATASRDNTARVIMAETGREISRLQHQDVVNEVAFYPNGKLFATASDDNTARVIEAATGREIARLPHEAEVHKVAISPDGRYLVTGSADHMLRLISDATGKQIFHDSSSATVLAVRLTPDGRQVAIAHSNGTSESDVVVFNVASGKQLLKTSLNFKVNDVAFSGDLRYAAIGGDTGKDHPTTGMTRVMEIATGREVAFLNNATEVWAVDLSPDGRYLATGQPDMARVVEVATGRELTHVGHKGPVIAVSFSRDGRYLATGSEDKTTRVLEVSGRELSTVTHQDAVVAVAFSNDAESRYIATGGRDGMLRIIESATGKEISRSPHRIAINSVAFSPDNHNVASGAADGSTHVIETSTGRELSIMKHQDPVIALGFSSKDVLETFAAHDIYNHLLPSAALINQACGVLPRNLTPIEYEAYLPGERYKKICPNLP